MGSGKQHQEYTKQTVDNLLRSISEDNSYTYVVSVTSEKFRQLGFYVEDEKGEEAFFNSFKYVDVYLVRENREFKVIYLLDGKLTKGFYSYEHEMGKHFRTTLEELLRVGGKKLYLAGTNISLKCEEYNKWVEHKPHLLGFYFSKNYGDLYKFCTGWGKVRDIIWNKVGDDERPDEYFFIVYD